MLHFQIETYTMFKLFQAFDMLLVFMYFFTYMIIWNPFQMPFTIHVNAWDSGSRYSATHTNKQSEPQNAVTERGLMREEEAGSSGSERATEI